MPKKMSRGKNQIMYGYLPGYVFDFDKSSAIAQVQNIRGDACADLNMDLILQAVRNEAAPWGDLAGVLRDPHHEQFVLLEPKQVYSALYPKVFWCQNKQCHRIYDYSHSDAVPKATTCPTCNKGRLAQLRFVRIHQCGDIKPLTPPYECSKCKSKGQFALDDRSSERISQFAWVCRKCGNRTSLYAGSCNSCNWGALSGDKNKQRQQMSIEVHRARRVFYPKDIVLLNQPGSDVNKFLAMDKWQLVAGGFFMELPELVGRTVKKYAADQTQTAIPNSGISDAEIAQLKARGQTAEQIQLFVQMQSQLSGIRQQQESSLSPDSIGTSLKQQTGISEGPWLAAGQELLEAVLPFQSSRTQISLLLRHRIAARSKQET